MCSPMAVIAVATAVQGYSAYQQGNYANDIAKYNARVTENQATQTRNLGVQQENVQREKTAQLAARQKATFASKGFDVNTGTAADIQQSTNILGEADALRIRTNYLNQAQALDQQAALDLAQGKAKKRAGEFQFGASLLTAGGQFFGSGVADKWFAADSAKQPILSMA